jgi:hypothetical protein
MIRRRCSFFIRDDNQKVEVLDSGIQRKPDGELDLTYAAMA